MQTDSQAWSSIPGAVNHLGFRQQRSKHLETRIDIDIRVIAFRLVQVIATNRAKTAAIVLAYDLDGHIEQHRFPDDGRQIYDPTFADGRGIVLCWIGRIGIQFLDIRREDLLEWGEATDAFEQGGAMKVTLRVDTRTGPCQPEGPGERCEFQFTEGEYGVIKLKVATVTDILMQQESDIQSQRMMIIQVRTAWLQVPNKATAL